MRGDIFRRQKEHGQVLVLFSIFLGFFLLLCAIVVDVGYWWTIGKKTQNAADACALAAASQLPASWNRTECMFAGLDYVMTNLPQDGLAAEPKHLSTSVKSPYPGGADPSSYVEAEVSVAVGTFFGRIVGLDHVNVRRRAVAEYSQGGVDDYAIYSHDSSCSNGLEFTGANYAINGRVHSNGQFRISNTGSPFWAKAGTRAGAGCGPSSSNAIRFGGSSWATAPPNSLPTVEGPQLWPEWFTPADFTCTFSAPTFQFNTNGSVIPSGTYCATGPTGLFRINGQDITGQITVLAPRIEVNGNNIDLTPHAPNGVLFFQIANTDPDPNNDGGPGGVPAPVCSPSSPPPLDLNAGNDSTWKGKIFNPCANVLIRGNGGLSLEGAIYGLRVKVPANNFSMTGTGRNDAGAKSVALVE